MGPRAFQPPRRSTASAHDTTSLSSDSDGGDEVPPPAAASRPPRRSSAAAAAATADEPNPLIPGALLTRIVQAQLERPDTKLGREARVLLGRYMETFIREALARAKHEMELAKGSAGQRAFLEVEDLEKLAPQLLLDF